MQLLLPRRTVAYMQILFRGASEPAIETLDITLQSAGEKLMTISKTKLGYLVQLGGIASLTLGAVFSMHHVAIGVAFLGGAAAFYVGEKIRTTT